MGRKVRLGRETRCYVNTGTYAAPVWTWLKKGRDKTLTDSRDKIEADTEESADGGYKASEDGLKDFALKYQTLVPAVDETDTAFDALEAAFDSSDPLDLLVVHGGPIATNGLTATRVLAGISTHELGIPLGGTETLDIEFFNKGSTDQAYPVKGTTSGGAFVAGS